MHLITWSGVAAVALATALTGMTPAGAAPKDGFVDVGEFGLYYAQGSTGTVLDLLVDDSDFSNDNFPGTTVGANNNTASYRNRDTFWWHVYTGAGYTGSHGCLAAGYVGNASPAFHNTITSAEYQSFGC
ncbi:MAG: hypothetical protein QOE45_1351 [Frankiaceae bacterium]|nr:hypothetical protein [Frankiaceae bacterium]